MLDLVSVRLVPLLDGCEGGFEKIVDSCEEWMRCCVRGFARLLAAGVKITLVLRRADGRSGQERWLEWPVADGLLFPEGKLKRYFFGSVSR